MSRLVCVCGTTLSSSTSDNRVIPVEDLCQGDNAEYLVDMLLEQEGNVQEVWICGNCSRWMVLDKGRVVLWLVPEYAVMPQPEPELDGGKS